MADPKEPFAPDPAEWLLLAMPGYVMHLGDIYRSRSADRPGSFLFRVEPRHANLNGVMHGGVFMSVADTAMGLSVTPLGAPHVPKATIQFDAHFQAAVDVGAVLEVECRTIRRTRQILFLDCIVSVRGATVATARGVWKVLDRPPGHAGRASTGSAAPT